MVSSRSLIISSPEEMISLGERIGGLVFEEAVIGLSGPLGAGKTTLVRGIAEGMGIDEGYVVSSPTYTILQVYPCGPRELYHLDLYRVSGSEDLDSTGYREGMGMGKILLVEWVEKIPTVLPPENLRILIDYSEKGRVVRLDPEGRKYRDLVSGVLLTSRDTG